MKTDLFDFDLPPERIALRPVHPRDAARLMVVRPGGAPEVEDRGVLDLPDILGPGDCLVVNDSKVIAARLKGRRIGRGDTEPSIEATLHKRIDGSTWKAFILGAKKVQAGDTLRFGDEGKVCFLGQLDAQVSHKDEGGEVTLSFAFHGAILDEAIAEQGETPLLPYIASKREPDEQDKADYQTVFAREEGSVAAPTAGLHFTDALLERLRAAGVLVHALTLHVGAATFRPVTSVTVEGHTIPPEVVIVPDATAAAVNRARAEGRRVVAVGTTVTRALESAVDAEGRVQSRTGAAHLTIRPGHVFRAVDALLTNFHLPRSSLLLLVAAFAGREPVLRAYRHAVTAGYRFYSYGDAMLIA